MKTIELDLEKDGQLEVLSDMLKQQSIEVGEEVFNLKILFLHDISQILYAGFLLLLVKYFTQEKQNKTTHVNESDLIYGNDNTYYMFYIKNNDTGKLKKRIEKDFKVNIEIDKKNPLDEVFGIWKNEDIKFETIRKKAWQRTK